MSFCRECGTSLHDTAPMCPHCGAPQQPSPSSTAPAAAPGTLWLPVPALVVGVLALLAAIGLEGADDYDLEEYIGTLMFACIAITLGAVGLSRQELGRSMSIAGLVLGILALLLVF